TDQPIQKSGITNAPLQEEEDQQDKVPARGESIIGKGQNRKPSSPHERREQLSDGDDQDL
ncbi:MAG TPA: hypothetical protein VJQ25_08375, partial [Nitrospira sp.]|nr:hypothetical protein [Nitrospira sp.]